MITLKHVLVATDFEEPSEKALSYGREFARAFHATLHVVHVVEDISGRLNGLPNLAEAYVDYGKWQLDAVRAAETRLDQLVSDEDRRVLNAKTTALIARAPAPAILDYAREHGVDLIIAGTHGRGVIGHLVLGSVAERIVRLAPCPVLVVRHPEREFVRPDALQVARLVN